MDQQTATAMSKPAAIRCATVRRVLSRWLTHFVCAENSNSTSQVSSLQINKGGDTAPTMGADSSAIAHAMNVPDSKHESLAFQKGDGTSQMGADSAALAHAMNAPKPPRHIGTIDKTQVYDSCIDALLSADLVLL